MRAHATRIWTKASIALVALGLVVVVVVAIGYAQRERAFGSHSTPDAAPTAVAQKQAEKAPATAEGPAGEIAELPLAVRTTSTLPINLVFPDGAPKGAVKVTVETANAEPGSKKPASDWAAVTTKDVKVAGDSATLKVRFKKRGRVLVRATVVAEGSAASSSKPMPIAVVGDKVVALTFDDGPSATTTPIVLKALEDNGARATFFVSGRLAGRHPKLVKREYAEGHEVMSHTMLHVDLTGLSADGLAEELANGKKAIEDLIGVPPKGVRPPYGAINDSVRQGIAEAGMMPVLWDVDTEDWSNQDASLISQTVAEQTRDGSIVLMHDSGGQLQSTGAAVEGVVESLKNDGFDFVTVSELTSLGRENSDKLTGSSGEYGEGFSN